MVRVVVINCWKFFGMVLLKWFWYDCLLIMVFCLMWFFLLCIIVKRILVKFLWSKGFRILKVNWNWLFLDGI